MAAKKRAPPPPAPIPVPAPVSPRAPSSTKPSGGRTVVGSRPNASRMPKRMGFLKQCWIWYEGSFAISMLETWEKILLHIFAISLFSMFSYAVSRYLPTHIAFVLERGRFYIFGNELEI